MRLVALSPMRLSSVNDLEIDDYEKYSIDNKWVAALCDELGTRRTLYLRWRRIQYDIVPPSYGGT